LVDAPGLPGVACVRSSIARSIRCGNHRIIAARIGEPRRDDDHTDPRREAAHGREDRSHRSASQGRVAIDGHPMPSYIRQPRAPRAPSTLPKPRAPEGHPPFEPGARPSLRGGATLHPQSIPTPSRAHPSSFHQTPIRCAAHAPPSARAARAVPPDSPPTSTRLALARRDPPTPRAERATAIDGTRPASDTDAPAIDGGRLLLEHERNVRALRRQVHLATPSKLCWSAHEPPRSA
jgi:hypothetical protein